MLARVELAETRRPRPFDALDACSGQGPFDTLNACSGQAFLLLPRRPE
jgi:hypothetical protein